MNPSLSFFAPTTRGDRKVELDDVPYTASWSHERSDGITPGSTDLNRVECDWDGLEAIAQINQYLTDAHDDEGDPPRFVGTGEQARELIDAALYDEAESLEVDQ